MSEQNQHSTLSSRTAAFEQWSQGGGRSDATWEITRAEAAYMFGYLRREGQIADAANHKVRELEEQLEAAHEEIEKRNTAITSHIDQKTSLLEQVEAWKVRAHAAEKVMLGTQEQLRQTDEVLALYQDRTGEPGWISPVQKVVQLQEQYEVACREREDWRSSYEHGRRIENGLREQFDALRAAVQKELAYMDGFPDVEDGSPLALVIESLHLALSNPASRGDA